MPSAVSVILFMLSLLVFSGLAFVLLAAWRFRREVRALARSLLASALPARSGVVSEDELSALPAPVQRWLRGAGVLGQPHVSSVRLRQRGSFRIAPDKPLMQFEAEQYYTVEPPQFAWFVRMGPGGLPLINGGDTYVSRHGRLKMQLIYLRTLADARGPKLDQGELMRWLSEIIWFPAAALSPAIAWESVDERCARATLTDGELSVSGVFYFNDAGQPLNFVALRYRGLNNSATLDRWETPTTACAEFIPGKRWQPVTIPSQSYVEWQLADGPQRYADVELTAVEYNVKEPY